MDKHIELSYCGFGAFKVLAKNYLDVESHHLFSKIECLLGETEMTPADVAENLMVNSEEEDSDECMKNLVEALEKAKKIKAKEEEEKLLEKEKEGILGTKDAVKCNGLINSVEEEGG
uniref:AAA+ ATPase At3g28540-like C-terminal domain-containing protein n=1 Tax=Cannabis sativa TaxID=3483 RepID=A0A803RBH6_CANSA